MYFHLLLIKGLTKVYTMRDIKHKNDRPQGIVNNNAGIIISILFSLSVQLHNVILSLLSVIFIISIYMFLNLKHPDSELSI